MVNSTVRIRRNPRAEVLAAFLKPARRLLRRESMQDLNTQLNMNAEQVGGKIVQRRLSAPVTLTQAPPPLLSRENMLRALNMPQLLGLDDWVSDDETETQPQSSLHHEDVSRASPRPLLALDDMAFDADPILPLNNETNGKPFHRSFIFFNE